MTINNVPAKKKENKAKPSVVATSSAILGRAMTKPAAVVEIKKVKPEWQGYYECLLLLRDQLLSQMSGLAKESAQEMPGYSLHMADSGTDNFDRDFALSLLSSDQDAVYEIEEALKRIEKKTYGVCELTGKPIPKARLEAPCASAGWASWEPLTTPPPGMWTGTKRNPRKKLKRKNKHVA
jgi:RNA polymerase-binding transcription factor DksA